MLWLLSRAIHICRDNARAERGSPKSLNFHKVIAWNVDFFMFRFRPDAAVIGCSFSRSHKHVSAFSLRLLRRNRMAFCEYNERNNHKVLS